jgi:hypothetical protein
VRPLRALFRGEDSDEAEVGALLVAEVLHLIRLTLAKK